MTPNNTTELIEALEQSLTDYFCDEGIGGAPAFIETMKAYGLTVQALSTQPAQEDVRELIESAFKKQCPEGVWGDIDAQRALGRALDEALSATHVERWRPIETAPRDGTHIDLLMYRVNRPQPEWIRYPSAWWESGKWYNWFGASCRACSFFDEAPQFWRPIDPPPPPPALPDGGE